MGVSPSRLNEERDIQSAKEQFQELNLEMTKDIFNRIKNKRKLTPRGIELEDQLPRVTDIFTKQAEVLFPAEPRPYVAPKDPLEILKEKFSKKKKKVKKPPEIDQTIPFPTALPLTGKDKLLSLDSSLLEQEIT